MPRPIDPDIFDLKQRVSESVKHLPKEHRKEVARKLTTALGIIEGTLASGAGHLMDRQLREFFAEYNGRIFNHGIDKLPISVAWMSAFLRYDKELNIVRLLEERDHLFSFSDFVDFATLEGAGIDPYAAARELPPELIHSYNSYEDPHDLRFTHSDKEFAIGGFSLVRRGTEVTVLAVAGEVADLDEKSEWAEDVFRTLSPAPGKEAISPALGLRTRAVPLKGATDLWKLVGFVRLDTEARTIQVRAVGRDLGTSYTWVTDDPSVIEQHPDPASTADEFSRELSNYDVLFEMAKTATLLPRYFAFKLTSVRAEQVQTRMGKALDSHDPQERLAARDVPPRDRVAYRRVSALRIVRPDAERIARRFSAPKYRVDVDGFWRRLDPGAIGRGPRGEAVEGRTWVRGHLRWRDRPDRPIQVLVKSRVALARAIVAADQLAEAVASSSAGAPQAGEVQPGVGGVPREVSRDEAYRERRKLTARVRYTILQRDDFRCQRCGADAASDRHVRLDVDHRHPVVHGGKTEPENLWTLCSRCNNGKGAALP